MNKKVLILYTSNTVGHKAIGENIGYYLSEAGYEVRLEDVLKAQKGWLVDSFRKLHAWINAYLPSMWSYLYQSGWFTNLTLKLRTKIAAKNYQQTQNIIDEFKPDIIITTQTTASAIVAFLKEQKIYTGRFGIAFSDYHLHRYWLYDQADFYLANIPKQKEEMEELGIPAAKIFVCGMLLKTVDSINVDAIKNRFGIMVGEKVVLYSSGSGGLGINKNLIEELSLISNSKLIVVCGNNGALYNILADEYRNNPKVIILGFYDKMSELYGITDIFLTKPGGLSIAEALRLRLPIIISHMLPGQEELNYDYLLEKGWVMPEPVNIAEAVKEELRTQAFRKVLQANLELDGVFSCREMLLRAAGDVIKDNQ